MPLERFILDFYGPFTPGEVRIDYDPAARPADPAVEQLKADWPAHVERVTRSGGVLFNGPLVRYLSHELNGRSVRIQAGPTDFATFFCTNYLNPHRIDEIGWQRFANPLGISANVITADGWILYGRRGQKVACHPGTVHAFGGSLEPTDLNGDGRLDPFESMARELREELSLTADERIDMVCLGMVQDPQLRQPELVFDAALSLTRTQLEQRLSPEDPEHDSIVAVADAPDALPTFVRETPSAVPILIGALALHARRAFGDDTYRMLL